MYEVGQEVAVASHFFVFQGSRARPRSWVFSRRLAGAEAVVVAVGQVMVVGFNVSFSVCPSNMQIKILNSIKT